MIRHLFIINPTAGSKNRSKEIIEKTSLLAKSLSNRHRFYTELTTHRFHATEIARNYAIKYPDIRIYACGGDGTVNEVLQGIKDYPQVKLSIIPIGTGNDFIKNIVDKDNHRQFNLNDYIFGEVKEIDAIKVNNSLTLNIVSIGFDAHVADLANRNQVFGNKSYLLAITMALVGEINMPLVYKINDHTYHSDVLLAFVANGKYYGGGMKIMPYAEVADGELEFVVIKKIGKLKFLSFFSKFISGNYLENDFVDYQKIKKVEIKRKDNKSFKINLDGEILELDYLNIEILPKRIKFIYPRMEEK